MAKQKGIIKLEGTIGDITFYKSMDGHLARAKGGVSAERIKTDPAFVRTRENGSEFKLAAQSGKLLRDSIRPLLMNATDSRVTSRLTKIMSNIAKQDTTSVRGARAASVGISTANGKNYLKLFNFNLDSILGTVLFKTWSINYVTGVVTLPNITPTTDIIAPAGATHFTISGGEEIINFGTATYDFKLTNVVNAAIGTTAVPVVLTPTALPAGTGTKLFFLKIEFFQMVNSVQYSLKNGKFDSLAIIDVS